MRNLVKRREKVNEDSKKDNADLVYLIKSAKNAKIHKDITVDLLEFLLLRRFNKRGGMGGNAPSENKKSSLLSIFFVIIALLSFILVGYQIYKAKSESSLNKNVSDGPYTVFKDVSKFGYLQLYGKTELLTEVAYELLRINNLILDTEPSLLYRLLKPVSKNVLLYGPPGTGKTLFVKKLAYVFDLEIKLRREKEKLGDEEFMKRSYTRDELKKHPPGCVLITVQPSSLIDKYVGTTEKNIQSLFYRAQIESQHAPVIIFIDEVDVFFGERKENTETYALNTKSEFLNILDGMRTNLEDRIFVIGATNFEKNIDDAFLRRLAIQIYFGPPGDNERKQILAGYMDGNDWRDEEKLNKLVLMTHGFTQNTITTAFQELIRRTCNTTGTFVYEDVFHVMEGYKNMTTSKQLTPTNLSLSEGQKSQMHFNAVLV